MQLNGLYDRICQKQFGNFGSQTNILAFVLYEYSWKTKYTAILSSVSIKIAHLLPDADSALRSVRFQKAYFTK